MMCQAPSNVRPQLTQLFETSLASPLPYSSHLPTCLDFIFFPFHLKSSVCHNM